MKFHDGQAGAAIFVRVTPNAKTNQVVELMADGRVKVKVAAPAVEGAANEALLKFLAKVLGVKRRDVEIAGGATSRDKLVSVIGLSAESLQERLAAAIVEDGKESKKRGGKD